MDKSLDKLDVLFADISGSTRLYEQHGDAIARADLGACITMLGGVSSGLDGETIKTIGDEIMCAFEEPIEAALTATLRVNGNFTSQRHAEITYRNGCFNLRDESVNGIVIVEDDGNVKNFAAKKMY